MKRLTLIGGGNMGEALVSGLLRSGTWKPAQITVCDVRAEALARLRKRYRIRTSTESRQAVRGADILLLAVKPQHMKPLLEDLGPEVRRSQLVLSIAAGISTRFIEKFLPRGSRVVRVMPNTPALVGLGMAALARGRCAKAAEERLARSIMETVGEVVRVSESAMDAVTAVSGSGPAYVFYVAEAMRDAGVRLGLSARVSDQLVRQTIKGAGALLAQSPEDAGELRRRVTSPGGTTEAAIGVMEKAKLHGLFLKALRRAAGRSRELSPA
jgi:pyrroline-5-carboxylate reductase